MEEKNKEDLKDADTEETSPESQETESEETEEESEESEEEEKDIDFEKELEKVQKTEPKSELEKAQRALHFNAQRLVELGGDPADVLKLKKEVKAEVKETDDVKSVVQKELDEREARRVSKNEAHFKLIKWYMDNHKLDLENAYILATKGQLIRSVTEIKRAGVNFAKPDGGGRKVDTTTVPQRSAEEVAVLERRGLRFNPKTKTYQGKFYEEYYDQANKMWKSRKIQR